MGSQRVEHAWATNVSTSSVYVGTSQVVLLVKNPSASAGDTRGVGLTPGLGRCPGGGHVNPLQYSCLENPHGQQSLAGYSPWGRRVGHNWSDLAQHSVYLWIPVSQSPNSYHLCFLPWCPYICFLHLFLYFWFANRFIYPIFLDSPYVH